MDLRTRGERGYKNPNMLWTSFLDGPPGAWTDHRDGVRAAIPLPRSLIFGDPNIISRPMTFLKASKGPLFPFFVGVHEDECNIE